MRLPYFGNCNGDSHFAEFVYVFPLTGTPEVYGDGEGIILEKLQHVARLFTCFLFALIEGTFPGVTEINT